MTTTAVPETAVEQTEAVLHVFRESARPLTLTEARAAYQGPRIKNGDWPGIVAELLRAGRLFECFPAGRAKRYWTQDEKQRIREAVERQLANQPLGRNPLVNAVSATLRGISTRASVDRSVTEMREEGLLHPHPGRTRASELLALHPFDPVAAIQITKGTLDALGSVVQRLEPFGLDLDQFLAVLRSRLDAHLGGNARPQPADGKKAGTNGTPPADTRGDEQPVARESANGTPPPQAELERLILKGMYDLEPNVASGAAVLLRDLRRHMPREYARHDTFDTAVINLAEQGRVVLHRHDQPSFLTDAERDELVRDTDGTYYTVIALRV